jgi:hypothetical protein
MAHRRHAALPEKMHPALVQTEIPVCRKKVFGLHMVRMAGHNEPVERAPIAEPGGLYFLRENLEKWLLLERSDGKGALRTIITKTRPLATGHGERRDATCAQRLLTQGPGAGPLHWIAAVGWQPRDRRRRQALEIGGTATRFEN